MPTNLVSPNLPHGKRGSLFRSRTDLVHNGPSWIDIKSMNGRSSSHSEKEQQIGNHSVLETEDGNFRLGTPSDGSASHELTISASCCHLHHGEERLNQLPLAVHQCAGDCGHSDCGQYVHRADVPADNPHHWRTQPREAHLTLSTCHHPEFDSHSPFPPSTVPSRSSRTWISRRTMPRVWKMDKVLDSKINKIKKS